MVAVGVGVALVVGGFYLTRGLLALGQLKRDPGLATNYDGRPVAGKGQNFLVLSRSTSDRTDVVIVAHLNQERNQLQLVSLPRDLEITVGGIRDQLQNFSAADRPGVLRAVESLLGARMSHVAQVDIKGFIGLTETLGGVTVDNPYRSTTPTGITFERGVITVRGETALAFVADDSAIPDRDRVLAERQRSVLRGVVLKVLRPETLANPVTFSAVVDELVRYVIVDESLTTAVLWDYATTTRLGGSADIRAAQPPVRGTSSTPTGDVITLLDRAKLAELGDALRSDTMAAYQARYPA